MPQDVDDRIEPTLAARTPQQVTHQAFPSGATNGRQEVVVVDIKIPFGSMIILMVKWAIASIPAFLILVFLGVLVAGLLGALVGR